MKLKSNTADGAVVGLGCGALLLIPLINLTIGALCARYVIEYWATLATHHVVTIPLWGALIVGLFGGELTIPAAVITYILHFFI